MASVDGDPATWWYERLSLIQRLERRSIAIDPSIKRLTARQMVRILVIQKRVTHDPKDASRLLAYEGRANTLCGPIRVAVVFPCCPFLSAEPWLDDWLRLKGHRPEDEPLVFALDGPTESPHRFSADGKPEDGGGDRLCLYYPNDPFERKWRPNLGLVGLFDMARVHLDAEHISRLTGKWPIPQAPHGSAKPARPNRKLLIQPSEIFGTRAA